MLLIDMLCASIRPDPSSAGAVGAFDSARTVRQQAERYAVDASFFCVGGTTSTQCAFTIGSVLFSDEKYFFFRLLCRSDLYRKNPPTAWRPNTVDEAATFHQPTDG